MSSELSSADFYDGLSERYHLIWIGWDESARKQGELIDSLLKKQLGLSGALDILDCTTGIGTQAVGLALQGHRVVGTDISPKEIERAKREAQRLGVTARFEVADMMKLPFRSEFDVALSYDNAIAHLKDQGQLVAALESMRDSVKPGGRILLSLRDYDVLAKSRPTGMTPVRINDQYGERIYMQTWDWDKAGDSYLMSLFILKNTGSKWESVPLVTTMRAWKRREIDDALARAGLESVEWIAADRSGFYQPIVSAVRSGAAQLATT